jgi:hypothetical protein
VASTVYCEFTILQESNMLVGKPKST